MKIENRKMAQDYMKKLNEGLRDQVVAKEVEIKNINKIYDRKIEDAKTTREIDLIKEQEKSNVALLEEVDRREETLNKVKENLNLTKDQIEKEQSKLTSQNDDKLQDLRLYFDSKYKQLNNESVDRARDIQFETDENLKNLEDQTHFTILDKQYKQADRLNNLDRTHEKTYTSRMNFNKGREKNQEIENAKRLAQQNLEFQQNKNELDRRQTIEMVTKQKAFKQEIDAKSAHYDDLIKQTDKSYKQKLQAMIETHEKAVKGMQDRFQNEIKTMISSHAETKELYRNMGDDQFYSIKKIQPKVKDMGNFYEIDLDMPAHEKDNVTMSGNMRELKITVARRFNEIVKQQSGEFDRSSRSEVMSKMIQLPEIIDDTRITQKYDPEQQVLSFRLPKA